MKFETYTHKIVLYHQKNFVKILESARDTRCKHAQSRQNVQVHIYVLCMFLRTFLVKNPVLLTEDGKRRLEEGELRLKKGDLRMND